MVLTVVSIHKGKTERKVADVLNHIITALIFFSTFCDIIKMNFGLDPAIPGSTKEVQFVNIKNN